MYNFLLASKSTQDVEAAMMAVLYPAMKDSDVILYNTYVSGVKYGSSAKSNCLKNKVIDAICYRAFEGDTGFKEAKFIFDRAVEVFKKLLGPATASARAAIFFTDKFLTYADTYISAVAKLAGFVKIRVAADVYVSCS